VTIQPLRLKETAKERDRDDESASGGADLFGSALPVVAASASAASGASGTGAAGVAVAVVLAQAPVHVHGVAERLWQYVKVRAVHDSDDGEGSASLTAEDLLHTQGALLQFRRGDEFFQVQSLDEARGALVDDSSTRVSGLPVGWCEGWFLGRRGYYPRSYVIREDELASPAFATTAASSQ